MLSVVKTSSWTSTAATSCAGSRWRWAPASSSAWSGRNGAGKSTTFRTIMGARKPVSGAIALEGRELVGLRAVRDRAPRRRLRAGGERGVRRPDGGREHPAADLDARRPRARPRSARRWPTACSPGSSATARAAASSSRAASARWCRSPARWRSTPSCCCWTSRPRACRRPSCPRSSTASPRSASSGHAVLIAEFNLHHVPDFADRLYVIERGEIIFAGAAGRRAQGSGRGQDRRGYV